MAKINLKNVDWKKVGKAAGLVAGPLIVALSAFSNEMKDNANQKKLDELWDAHENSKNEDEEA